MTKPSRYAKALNAAMMTFLGVLAGVLTAKSGVWPDPAEWLTVAAATWVAAWSTYQTPNSDGAAAGPLPVRLVPPA